MGEVVGPDHAGLIPRPQVDLNHDLPARHIDLTAGTIGLPRGTHPDTVYRHIALVDHKITARRPHRGEDSAPVGIAAKNRCFEQIGPGDRPTHRQRVVDRHGPDDVNRDVVVCPFGVSLQHPGKLDTHPGECVLEHVFIGCDGTRPRREQRDLVVR